MLRLTVQLDQLGGIQINRREELTAARNAYKQTPERSPLNRPSWGETNPCGGLQEPATLVFLALHAHMNAHENSLPQVPEVSGYGH